jgi:hypothetical protein
LGWRNLPKDIRKSQRTRRGPPRPQFSSFGATSKAGFKRPRIIPLSDVATRFDDACICRLAQIAELPPNADLEVLGLFIREAADLFVRDALSPTSNEIRNEIASLHDALERRDYDRAISLLDELSLEARARLGDVLPTPADLRDADSRDETAAALASLCRIGGQRVEGRRRPDGTRSPSSVRPYFNAPEASRTFLRREAERYFVERLSIAWCRATSKAPPRTARRASAERDIGPFARLVRECLRLVGAAHADPVALTNAVGAPRTDG